MKRFLTKKQILLAISLLLVVFATVGGTLAWLFAKTDALKNIFDPVTIDCQAKGERNSDLSYSGTVTNTGTADAYVRMAAVPSFANGTTVHYTKPDVKVEYENAEEWTLAADGFYYYWKPLAPQETTSKITLSTTSEAPTGYTYTVEFLGEAIQSEPPTVVQTAWPLVIYGTTVEKPSAFVSVSTLGTATDGYVYLDVATSSYLDLGGIAKPGDNNNEYYRLKASNKGSYPSDSALEASTTAGGTIRFSVSGESVRLRLKAVPRTDYSYYQTFGEYAFDVYTGAGTSRTFHTTLKSSAFSDNEITFSVPDGAQEIMICLPYDCGFSSLQVGISEDDYIAPASERLGGKIGFYGSSITQGYSSHNPSLTYAMKLCRAMDADCVNFGSSGSAGGEISVIDDICEKIRDAGLTAFILDYDWNINSSADLKNGGYRNGQLGYGYYTIYTKLRDALGPDVPIIMMSRPYYYGTGNLGVNETEADNCIAVIQNAFETARAAGDDKVAFISGKTFFPADTASAYISTDNLHPSEDGFENMYNAVLPILKQLLADNGSEPTVYTKHSGVNMFNMNDHFTSYANMGLLEAESFDPLRGAWDGWQMFLDTTDKYTFYITYSETKWVNEIHLKSTSLTEPTGVKTYYSNGNSGWTAVDLVDAVHLDSEDRLVFTFEAVKAKNFMVHMANPNANASYNWYEDNFFGVYDPEGSANDSDVEQALAQLDKVGLNFAYTDGRTPYSYSGTTTLTGSDDYASLYGNYTYDSLNGTTNNPAVHYASAVTFNTFTVFQEGSIDAYENFRYAEIWYHNGDLTGADPRTYWTQAELHGVVLTEGSATDTLCSYVFPGANSMNEGYTYILSAPVTAKYIMVNFVYDSSRADGEGVVYQMLSFAGFDRDYAGYDLPMTQLGTSVTLDVAYTENRTGVCYYGIGNLTTAESFGALWPQSTNQQSYTYDSAAHYTSANKFNTFTVFATANSYENFQYAEIWYYNGALQDNVDPRTYWTKAPLKGVVKTSGSDTNTLFTYVNGAGSTGEAYTYVLSTPVTAQYVMVNFVYNASRDAGEGEVYQMLSYAGYASVYDPAS